MEQGTGDCILCRTGGSLGLRGSSIPGSRPSQDWSSEQVVGSAGLALCLIPAQVEEAAVGQKLLC